MCFQTHVTLVYSSLRFSSFLRCFLFLSHYPLLFFLFLRPNLSPFLPLPFSVPNIFLSVSLPISLLSSLSHIMSSPHSLFSFLLSPSSFLSLLLSFLFFFSPFFSFFSFLLTLVTYLYDVLTVSLYKVIIVQLNERFGVFL